MSLHADFKRTEGQLIVAIDKWAHILGYPGGFKRVRPLPARDAVGLVP